MLHQVLQVGEPVVEIFQVYPGSPARPGPVQPLHNSVVKVVRWWWWAGGLVGWWVGGLVGWWVGGLVGVM